ncbi:hypothetical protein [Pseudomonas aeruginosa]|uniref:hypothetical protein n=1 Tax=Pseudomonas aeruginosa TaxID=287 RepID=UPI001F046ED7|nr:hypothetical protein [Pseudomonas aeruginosa]
MEQAMREEFEAWVSGRKVCTRYGAKLNTNPDGMYSDYRINDRWLAWKASRAALRVVLPDRRDPLNWTGDDENPRYAGFNECLERVKEALQQAGIEVKP